MLRIAVADVPSLTVVRDGGFTLLLRPALLDRDQGVEDARLLLTPEEVGIIRCAMGVRGGPPGSTTAERYEGVMPDLACPCYIPRQLRSPLDTASCPVHADLVEKLRERGIPARPPSTPV